MGYPIEERVKNVEATVQNLSAALFTGHPEQDTTFQGIVTDIVTAEDCTSSYLVVRPYDPKNVTTPDGFLVWEDYGVNPMDGIDPSSRVAIVFCDNVPVELYGIYFKLGDIINYRRYTAPAENAAKVIGSFVTHKEDLSFWAHVKAYELMGDSPCFNMYTFTACRYDRNGSTEKDKFPVYTLCNGDKFTGICRNLAQLLGTPEAVPNWLIAEQVVKVYPFPCPVKDGTPSWVYYFDYTANQVMKGTVFSTDACQTSIKVKCCANASGDDADVVTLTLPVNTGDGYFVGLNLTVGATVYYLTTGHNKGILLNPYKSFDVKYKHTTGVPEVPDCESLRFNDTDFTIDTASHSPCTTDSLATISSNGLTVEAKGYGVPATTTCKAKIVKFDYTETGDETVSDPYGVSWACTDDTEADPCAGTADVLKRALVKGTVFIRKPLRYDADEVWITADSIDATLTRFEHIGPSTTAATDTTITSISLDGTTLKIIPKLVKRDAKGHVVSIDDGSDGDALTVDLSSLMPATTTVDVLVAPISAECNEDGTITVTATTQTITVLAT